MINDRTRDRVSEAITQLQVLIERFVKNSLRGDLYDKAIECMRAMREACVREDEGQRWNEFLRDKVKRVFATGSYKGFYEMVKQAHKSGQRLTLITHKESQTSSDITEEEANKVNFYSFFMLLCSSLKLKSLRLIKMAPKMERKSKKRTI